MKKNACFVLGFLLFLWSYANAQVPEFKLEFKTDHGWGYVHQFVPTFASDNVKRQIAVTFDLTIFFKKLPTELTQTPEFKKLGITNVNPTVSDSGKITCAVNMHSMETADLEFQIATDKNAATPRFTLGYVDGTLKNSATPEVRVQQLMKIDANQLFRISGNGDVLDEIVKEKYLIPNSGRFVETRDKKKVSCVLIFDTKNESAYKTLKVLFGN